jgi:hypothetical protein
MFKFKCRFKAASFGASSSDRLPHSETLPAIPMHRAISDVQPV